MQQAGLASGLRTSDVTHALDTSEGNGSSSTLRTSRAEMLRAISKRLHNALKEKKCPQAKKCTSSIWMMLKIRQTAALQGLIYVKGRVD